MQSAIVRFTEISDKQALVKNPLVSIVMITYNHENYIETAIEGVISQQVEFEIELIIGEDCSTDNTRKVVVQLQEKYPEMIRVICPDKNMGAVKNFDSCLKLCRGKYVAICEGDDIWNDVTKLKTQIAFLEINSDYVVTYHDFLPFKINKNNTNEYLTQNSLAHLHDTSAEELILGGGGLQTCTMCFRNVIHGLPKEFHKVIGGDVFLRSLLGNYGKGKYLRNIKPALYRIHSGGAWSGLEKDEQTIGYVNTRYWIALYYKRIQKQEYANRFAAAAMTRYFTYLNVHKFALLRWFLKMFFDRLYNIYRKSKKKVHMEKL